MAGAFEIVMQERKTLVDKIISMMKQGDFFHNASEWDRTGLRSGRRTHYRRCGIGGGAFLPCVSLVLKCWRMLVW